MKIEDFKLSCELVGHKLDVRTLSYNQNNNYIVSGSRDKTAKIWKSTTSGSEFSEYATLQHHTNFVAATLVIEELNWICTASNDSTICVYKYSEPQAPFIVLKDHTATVCCLAQGTNSTCIISGSWDKTARIWTDINEKKSIVLQGHEAAVWAVAKLCTTSVKYATGSADKNIFIWNGKGEKVVVLKGHKDCVRGLLSLPNGVLLSCSNDATIRHWNEDYECVREFHGHSNYIYSIAANPALGNDVFVSCGEDSTIRMWSLKDGALGNSLELPAQSVWTIMCLSNGDIVAGSSDAIVRIFSRDQDRLASQDIIEAYENAVQIRKAESTKTLGDVNVNDLPGPESLLVEGKEGQTRLVRHPDGKIICYQWTNNKWDCVGDVMGASSGDKGKQLFEGREYDYVFSVNLTDDAPNIKLPYNRGEDPWFVAQKFIHKHNLPQIYLDQVANFIVKNSDSTPLASTAGSYFDPFTGGSRYIPGSGNRFQSHSGNTDPFTGDSSYTTQTPNVGVHFRERSKLAGNADPLTGGSSYTTNGGGSGGKKDNQHFPFHHYSTLEKCDLAKVLDKLKELNGQIPDPSLQLSVETIEDIKRFVGEIISGKTVTISCVSAIKYLFTWPAEKLFPILDMTRLIVKDPTVCEELLENNFIDTIIDSINSLPPNQLMSIRCLVNILASKSDESRSIIVNNLRKIFDKLQNISSGTANLQIAIGTFFLNLTIVETLAAFDLFIENWIIFFLWATDNEAIYRSFQALGNVLTKSKDSKFIVAKLKARSEVVDKILYYISNEMPGGFAKLNECANYLYEILI
uniref:Putative phospholipase a2-activating protein n=1 Tax=Corethrella appendiculata TaxID=1370023 RepID=U5EYL3_9DIPT